jgi:low temperature requirement protein LtrA
VKRIRTPFAAIAIVAVLAILVLAVSALLPGGLQAAVLAVALLVLPLAPTLTRRWAVLSETPSDPHASSLALLRGPPAPSFDR